MSACVFTRRRAFTLIELLTVIAIIGILAAIIIPTVGKVRETAKNATCLSNIRQVGMAMRLYVDDHKGVFPLAFNNPPSNSTWDQEIEPYLPKRDKNSWNAGHNRVMQCPSIKWDGVAPSDAGNCYSLVGAALGLNGTASDTSKIRRYSSVRTPSVSPWLLDGAQANPASPTGKFYAKYAITRANITADATGNTNVNADFRHGDKMNMSMADGSVKCINRAAFLTTYPDNIAFNSY